MIKNTKNTAKFGKLLELISKTKMDLLEGKPASLQMVQAMEEKASALFENYKNYVTPKMKANRQLRYLRFKQFVEGKK